MASAKALEAKHEKILRALSKQPENKRCINCETLGPGYVVTDLRIFVCTTCAGVHRNFGHRVKSISMATFTPQEIKNMQEGGNLVAEATYLARWNPSELAKPTDRKDAHINKWIRSVFQDKRYYTEHPEITQDTSRVHEVHASNSGTHVMELNKEKPSKPFGDGHVPKRTADPQPSLIDFGDEPAPSPATAPVAAAAATAAASDSSGWAAFGDDQAPASADPLGPTSVAQSAAVPAVESGGWASFGSPPPAATPVVTASEPAPVASDGWAAFGDDPSAATASHADHPGAGEWASFGSPPKAEVSSISSANTSFASTASAAARKELPSDLFSDPTPTYTPAPSFGHSPGKPPYVNSMPPAYGAPPYGAPSQFGGSPAYGSMPSPPRAYGAPPPTYAGMPSSMPPGSAGGNPFGGPLPGGQQMGIASYGGGVPGGGIAGSGGFFGGQHMGVAPVGGPPPTTGGGGGNPFALVSQETQVKEAAPPDAFTDLLPSFGSALPTSSRAPSGTSQSGMAGGASNAPRSPAADPFASFAATSSAAPSSSDPFVSLGGGASSGFTQSSPPASSVHNPPALGAAAFGTGSAPPSAPSFMASQPTATGYGAPQGGGNYSTGPSFGGYGSLQPGGMYGAGGNSGGFSAAAIQAPGQASGNPFA